MRLNLTTDIILHLFCVFLRTLYRNIKHNMYVCIYHMFSHEEQEEIMGMFFCNAFQMKVVIQDKASVCKNCKFNQQNMSSYKLNILDIIVEHIIHIIMKNARCVKLCKK